MLAQKNNVLKREKCQEALNEISTNNAEPTDQFRPNVCYVNKLYYETASSVWSHFLHYVLETNNFHCIW